MIYELWLRGGREALTELAADAEEQPSPDAVLERAAAGED
jgi:hypothetical protein